MLMRLCGGSLAHVVNVVKVREQPFWKRAVKHNRWKEKLKGKTGRKDCLHTSLNNVIC
jgi:hypothetical protein